MSENSYFYSLLFNTTWEYFKAKLAKRAQTEVFEYAIPTVDKFSDSQELLASQLIKRMYSFCQSNNIKLIIVDIPRKKEGNNFESSIPPSLLNIVKNCSNACILSESILGVYTGVAEIHKPHGHNHISEFTHTILGVNIGKIINKFLNNQISTLN